MKELLIRSVFGLVFLAVVFVPIITDINTGLNTFALVLFLFALIGTAEYFRMSSAAGHPSRLLSVSLLITMIAFAAPVILGLIALYIMNSDADPLTVYDMMLPIEELLLPILESRNLTIVLWALYVITCLVFSILTFVRSDVKPLLQFPVLSTLLYPILPFALLALAFTQNLDGDRESIIVVLLPIYLNDTLAYVTGRLIGKTPLIPSVSPKKTWEGFIGGVVGALTIMHVLLLASGNYTSSNALMISFISVMASILATLGDLFESKLKRSAGVKDSGTILPGHGGILDRIDAMLFVAPILYVFLALFY